MISAVEGGRSTSRAHRSDIRPLPSAATTAHTALVVLERRGSELEQRESWREFQRFVATYLLVGATCVGIWLIQGADGVLTVRRRDVTVGFWPAWPLVIGFLLVAARAWRTFVRPNDE